MTPLTEDELARLEALAEKATPGPWERGRPESGPNDGSYEAHRFVNEARPMGREIAKALRDKQHNAAADAAYIAAAHPGTVLSLIAALRDTPVAEPTIRTHFGTSTPHGAPPFIEDHAGDVVSPVADTAGIDAERLGQAIVRASNLGGWSIHRKNTGAWVNRESVAPAIAYEYAALRTPKPEGEPE